MIGARTAVAAALAAAATFVCASAQQGAIFHSGANGVVVDVAVAQGNRPVAGLTSADFELRDNGVVQTVDASTLQEAPLDLTLILDASASVYGQMFDRLKDGLRDTAHWLGPNDRWRLISVQHMLHEVVSAQPGGTIPEVEEMRAQGGTALYDGLAAAMMRESSPNGRSLIVAYTDGADSSSITSEATALEVALRADTVVHIVVPVEDYHGSATPYDGARPHGRDVFAGESALGEIAARTGGGLLVVDLDASVSATIRRVLDDFRTSYVLRYVPTGVAAAGWHDITVRVPKDATATIQTRRGYSGG